MDEPSENTGISSSRYNVPSVRTAISILELLKRKGYRRCSLAEICKHVEVSKSSAFTVLKTLQDAGFVKQDEIDRKYSLGLALLELGGAVADQMDDVALARPFISELAAQTQETCVITRWINRQFVVLHCEEPRRDVRVTMAIGERFRHVLSAFGKAYLAYQRDETVSQILDEPMIRRVNLHVAADPQKLLIELAKTRSQGYAESYGEAILGVNALAAPVFDRHGNVCLVIGTLGFTSTLSPELMHRDGALVKEAAAKISIALGYSNPPEQLVLDQGVSANNRATPLAEH